MDSPQSGAERPHPQTAGPCGKKNNQKEPDEALPLSALPGGQRKKGAEHQGNEQCRKDFQKNHHSQKFRSKSAENKWGRSGIAGQIMVYFRGLLWQTVLRIAGHSVHIALQLQKHHSFRPRGGSTIFCTRRRVKRRRTGGNKLDFDKHRASRLVRLEAPGQQFESLGFDVKIVNRFGVGSHPFSCQR